MILAGDIGGTKCNLALYQWAGNKLQRVAQRRFASSEFAQFSDVVTEFLRLESAHLAGKSQPLEAAGFGAAGPVVDNKVQTTNLPWLIDGPALAKAFDLVGVTVLNDLEAAGYGLPMVEPAEMVTLNPGTPAPDANQALIAAGTGLGEAILFWDGKRRVVLATEGGHTDFAPRTEQEIELLRFLQKRTARVSWEEILSGRGFLALHEFFDPQRHHEGLDNPDRDPAPEISRHGQAGDCDACVRAVELWVALYGAEAGNLALKSLARGGVFIAGGIAAKLLGKLKEGSFVQAFCAKSRFESLLAAIPIHVVLDENLPLLGAAAHAWEEKSGAGGG